MKKRKQARRILAAVLAGSLLLSVSAFAYDRQEASTIGGGTEVTVYAGTQNSNSEGNYLEDPGDYMAYNRYETPGYETSESNITSSTNFTATSAGGEIKIVNGGVAGVSWDNSNNTLTLNSATGTVITIEGPEIDPYSVNTYNDKLNPLIGDNLQNLTYYKQYDLFTFTGQEAGAPHTKDNSTVQDVVYINIEGENSFNNIVITGNVKVVFTGTGTLTLDASQTWDYDDYNDPDFDHLSDPSTEALASYPTVGYQGTLSGMVEEDVMSNARMTETVTEWYEYALPEIVIDGSMYISEGGSVYNTAAVDSDSEYQAWESYVGTEDSPASKVVITAVTFTDVQDSTRYFYTPVYWAYENGITDGMTETTFVPAGDCTRAQFVTFLYRLAGEPDVTGLTTAFTDLESSRFYYNAVLWAEANDITEGMTDTTFEPSTTITRAQAVTFLYRYAKYVNGSEPEVTITSTPFTDLDNERFYYTAVLWAYENGIAKGMTDTTFEPGTTCNRGMMVTFIYRMVMAGIVPDATENLTASEAIENVYAIGFVDADGAKLQAIAIEYSVYVSADSVSLTDYTVEDYGVYSNPACQLGENPGEPLNAYVNTTASISKTGGTQTGKYVIIEVNTDYQVESVPSYLQALAVSVTQTGEVATASGNTISASEEAIVNYKEVEQTNRGQTTLVRQAQDGTYVIEGIEGYDVGLTYSATNCFSEATGEYSDIDLLYSIYVPEDYDPDGSYALVLHMHDGGATGTDPMLTLTKGQAPSNFASDEVQQLAEDQGLDGIIVVCPQYSGKGANDNYALSDITYAVWQLMDYLTETYSIDMNRIYGSGQSMGSMMLLGMACQRDNYFAALWEQGSTWGSNYEKDTEYNGSSYYATPDDYELIWNDWENYYYLISDDNILCTNCVDDALTYLTWTELSYLYEDIANVEIPYVEVDPLEDSVEEQNAALKALLASDNETGIYWQSFEGGSHLLTWIYGHKLDAGYEWLLSQTKESEDARVKLEALNNQWAAETDEEVIASYQTEERLIGQDSNGNDVYYAVPAEGAGTIGYNTGWYNTSGTVLKAPGWTSLIDTFAVNMNGEGGLINDEMYDELYAEGSANEGILAIIEAGNFVINGYAMPGTEEDYLANWADTGYLVNASAWVTQNEDGTWTTSSRKAAGPYDTVAEACLAILTVKDQLNGQDICLYDKDGDGYVDVIELSYVSAIIVNGITDNGDGTYSVDSGYIAQGTVGTEKPYDGDAFSADSDRVINAENFDDSIELGDVAIFYYGTDGWVLTRALEITGVLTEAVDHDHYTVNDTEYGDAMMFSRDNLVISNRNGEYANAYMYFGMDDLEMEVSLWLVPTTNYPTSTGAPIGITSADVSASLTEALKQAQAKLDSVVVSDETNASALEEGTQWVTQETYDQLKAAIDRASEALESESRADLLDYQVYLLYLTLHGSADDIGASFAGYTYDGFDNLINTATNAEETA